LNVSPLVNKLLDDSCYEKSVTILHAKETWEITYDTQSLPKCDKTIEDLKIQMNESDISRLNAACAHHSGDWLNVLPSKNLGTLLSNKEIRIECCFRLGLEIVVTHKCIYENITDATGLQALTCKRNGARHQGLNQQSLRDATYRTT